MKKINGNFFVSLFFCLVLLSQVSAENSIVIMHTNDTHARLVPFDHKVHGPDCGGIVRRAGLVKQIRETFPEALLLDAGDIFQGTPFYSIFKGEACYKAAVACGYDATTMGNHELDNNLGNLQTQIEKSGMRFLCCNVFYRDTSRTVFAPYHIFKRNGLKIAVIGSIGNDAWESIDRKIRANLEGRDQTISVRQTAQRIRPYVDLIVVLSHAGIIEDKQMAADISEIDVLIGGHSHEELHAPLLIKNNKQAGASNNGLDGTIVAQAGEHGVFLGQLNLTITDDGKIASWSGSLNKVTAAHEAAADNRIKTLVESYQSQLSQVMQQVVGYSEKALPLPKDQKKTHMLPMGTFTAQCMREAGKADFCAINSGAIKTGLEAGDITQADIYEALPYDNSVITFTMSGEAVQKMLDYICANHHQLDGFQFAGLEADFDLGKAQARNIKINGQPLDPKKNYRAATSTFVANGNLGGDILFARIEQIEDAGILMRDAAIAYLQKVGKAPDFSTPPVNIIRKAE